MRVSVSPTLIALLSACFVFIIAPYSPGWLLKLLVGTSIGCIVTFVAVLLVLQYDVVIGLATFMAVAALFLEHRRRTVIKVTSMLKPNDSTAEIKELDVPSPNVVPGEVHPPRREAEVEESGFEPTEESGKNDFERVDESQDNKQPLDTVPPQPSEVSKFLQDKGLATLI
jgi:energy-converting hydrogenase Eha subunit E